MSTSLFNNPDFDWASLDAPDGGQGAGKHFQPRGNEGIDATDSEAAKAPDGDQETGNTCQSSANEVADTNANDTANAANSSTSAVALTVNTTSTDADNANAASGSNDNLNTIAGSAAPPGTDPVPPNNATQTNAASLATNAHPTPPNAPVPHLTDESRGDKSQLPTGAALLQYLGIYPSTVPYLFVYTLADIAKHFTPQNDPGSGLHLAKRQTKMSNQVRLERDCALDTIWGKGFAKEFMRQCIVRKTMGYSVQWAWAAAAELREIHVDDAIKTTVCAENQIPDLGVVWAQGTLGSW